MNVEDGIILKERALEARKTITALEMKTEDLERDIKARQGNFSRTKLIGSIIGTILWLIANAAVCYYITQRTQISVRRCILVPGAITFILCAILLYSEIARQKYYGRFIRYLKTTQSLKRLLSNAIATMERSLSGFTACGEKGWRADLGYRRDPPVPAVIERIHKELAGLDSLKDGITVTFSNILYFLACIAWTAFGSLCMQNMAADTLRETFRSYSVSISNNTARVIVLVVLIIACLSNCFVAKVIWTRTDIRVNNTTMFALLTGIALFWAGIFAVIIGAGLVYIVVQFIKGLIEVVLYLVQAAIALAVGAFLLSAFLGGG